jgi:hypothetical protein
MHFLCTGSDAAANTWRMHAAQQAHARVSKGVMAAQKVDNGAAQTV